MKLWERRCIVVEAHVRSKLRVLGISEDDLNQMLPDVPAQYIRDVLAGRRADLRERIAAVAHVSPRTLWPALQPLTSPQMFSGLSQEERVRLAMAVSCWTTDDLAEALALKHDTIEAAITEPATGPMAARLGLVRRAIVGLLGFSLDELWPNPGRRLRGKTLPSA